MSADQKPTVADAASSSNTPTQNAAGSATTEKKPPSAEEAAAIAARIAASLKPSDGTVIKRNMEDQGFVRDIEINDLRNRYLLTKTSTQKEVEEASGATVETRGVWVPERDKLAPGEIPLYLHVVAKSQIILDAAVAKINEFVNQDLGPLIDDRTIIARNRALGLPLPQHLDAKGRVKWPEAKLPIGLDSLRNFNVRAKTVGPGGMFVKYIQAETGARVQIKGLGSGFLENETGREAEEPMHINIAAPNQDQIDRAKGLAEDLLVVLRQEYVKARDGTANGGSAGVYQGYGNYAPAADGSQDPYAGYYAQQGAQAGAAGGQTPGSGAAPQQGSDAWAQYAQYWAAYGYDVNDPQFQAWQASQYSQQQAAGGVAPTA